MIRRVVTTGLPEIIATRRAIASVCPTESISISAALSSRLAAACRLLVPPTAEAEGAF